MARPESAYFASWQAERPRHQPECSRPAAPLVSRLADTRVFVCDDTIVSSSSNPGAATFCSFGSLDGPPFHPRAPYGVTVGAGRVYVSEARGTARGACSVSSRGARRQAPRDGAAALATRVRSTFSAWATTGGCWSTAARTPSTMSSLCTHACASGGRCPACRRPPRHGSAGDRAAVHPGRQWLSARGTSFARQRPPVSSVVLDAINRNAIGRVQ